MAISSTMADVIKNIGAHIVLSGSPVTRPAQAAATAAHLHGFGTDTDKSGTLIATFYKKSLTHSMHTPSPATALVPTPSLPSCVETYL
jgi:hypothetical protein